MSKTYYELLEISNAASNQDIKNSFKRLAKKYHPDINKTDKNCEEIFKEILNAYEILSDDKCRKSYDRAINETFIYDEIRNTPYEPQYTNIREVIKILQNLKVELIKIKVLDANVNALYTILNHILNPKIILQQISSKNHTRYLIIITSDEN